MQPAPLGCGSGFALLSLEVVLRQLAREGGLEDGFLTDYEPATPGKPASITLTVDLAGNIQQALQPGGAAHARATGLEDTTQLAVENSHSCACSRRAATRPGQVGPSRQGLGQQGVALGLH